MSREVNLAIFLICHHGHFEGFERDSRIIKAVSIDKGMPLTHFISGLQLDQMQKHRGEIHHTTWFDIVDLIRNSRRFINPRFGDNDPHKSEIGIMPYNHIPLVHPFAPEIWGIYFDGILKDQILWSKGIAEQHYGITPVSIHPPDGIYSPAAAHTLKQCGLDNVVVSSEHMWDPHDKGLLYFASGLRHVVRTNDVQLQSYWNAREFVDRVVDYANQHNLHFVTVGLDSDTIPLDSLIPRLCCISDEAYRKGVKLVNINAAAHWNMWHDNLERVWGGWNNTYAMMQAGGGLDFIDWGKNHEIGHVVCAIAQRYYEGWDSGTIEYAKHRLWQAADAACRNGPWACCLDSHYHGNMNEARRVLCC